METSTRFCENCGQPLSSQTKFCGSCGQPVKPLPGRPPAPIPPSAPGGYPSPQQPLPTQGDIYPPQTPQSEVFSPQPPLPPQDELYPPQPDPRTTQGVYYPPQPPVSDPFGPPPQAQQGGYYPPQPPVSDPFAQQPTPGAPWHQRPGQVSPSPWGTVPQSWPSDYPPPELRAPEGVQPAPAYPQEQVYGAIPGASRKKGFMGMNADNYILVVTNQRILFATQSKEIMQQQTEQARQAAKAQGKNFLSQWGAQLTANNGQRYLQMDPQAVLAEHPGNFFYLNSQIRSVHFSRYEDNETNRTDYAIELDTVAGKVKLNFSALNEHEVKNLLRSTLGNIVR